MKKTAARRKSAAPKKHKHAKILFFSLVFFSFLTAGFFLKNDIANSQQRVLGISSTNEIIVKYKETAHESEKENVRKAHKVSLKNRIPKISSEVVQVLEGTVEEKTKQLSKNPFVEYAEPNFKAEAFGISNDTSLPQQWGLFKINAANTQSQSAWDVTNGNSSVKVAILDTGIEESHPDLSGKVVGSMNFTTSPTANDTNGHGTHVAGITAASTNNGNGVAGAGYNTALLNGKVLGDDGSGYYSWIAQGIIWATDQQAQVINLSLGGSSASLALQDAINYAWSRGVVVVAAAGNSNTSSPNYPAYYTNVIAVGATDSNDNRASFSNYGSWVDVAAPGTGIFSTYKGGGYSSMSGTSMATPFTAGTAALIWAKGSCTTNTCVREKLEQSADRTAGTGTHWTWGRINAYNSVNGIITIPASPTVSPAPSVAPQLLMTVSDIEMSYISLTGTNRRISAVVSVVNEASNVPLSSANVNATIISPTGKNFAFVGKTNTRGKVTFSLRHNELGTYLINISNVTKSSYVYNPTTTTKSLLVK